MVAAYIAGVPLAEIYPPRPYYVCMLARQAGVAQRRPRLTREQEQSIVDAYLADVPMAEIGRDNSTVYNVLRRRGLRPQRYRDRSWLPAARRMLAEGMSVTRIARELELHWSTVAKALREAGT